MNCDINWHQVLGPLLTSSQDIPTAELKDLSAAIWTYAPRAVRVKPGLECVLPFESQPIPWFSQGRFVVDPRIRPAQFLQYAGGDYYVQDAASLLALELCCVRPGQLIIDLCAAPGGKSTGLLELLDGQGCLICNEVIGSRLPILCLAIEKSGYSNCIIMNRDAEQLSRWIVEQADCVLVDAPCSGQSMLARGKQSMSAFSARQIDHNVARQRRILDAASNMVLPGGRLVYSTCTFSFAENEAIVEDFLRRHEGWQAVSHARLKHLESSYLPGCYRLWPHRHSCNGAFAAALKKRDASQAEENLEPAQDAGRLCDTGEWMPFSITPSMTWVGNNACKNLFVRRGEVHLFPANADPRWIANSVGAIRIARFRQNLPAAEPHVLQQRRKRSRKAERGNSDQRGSANDIDPLYGSSRLDSELMGMRPTIEVTEERAKQFIAGETIKLTRSEAEAAPGAGWCVVQWRGRRLGWAKNVEGVLKNHFPKLLRQTLD